MAPFVAVFKDADLAHIKIRNPGFNVCDDCSAFSGEMKVGGDLGAYEMVGSANEHILDSLKEHLI